MSVSLELKIPPAALFIAAVCAVVLIAQWPIGKVPALLQLVGLLIIGAGVLIILSAVVQFRRHKTTLDPRTPDNASALLTSGIFAISRNPIYLAFVLLLFGLALASNSWLALLIAPAFGGFLQVYQIKPEERQLARSFGASYNAYCQRTRRWLGRSSTDAAK
ncbi:methyltransferase family protein [Salinimonas sediminis]|uniref:Isoprenylcysteine carboxylmethyltransferase family protein n=1 Tax=Salinimonas sediminis TaxID=2303538 RepID=A0A346NND7_9ALTE|nr:isoprenylcysteine carboxylmethyltransferase family protein [Salinimonas sediminis]AXR07044.1 isoprenylcysteine carboxylmethyltransferase family protein [Salinimonas sediminis]